MAESIQVFAPAKVNLWLHVTGRRDDGFHLLDMLVVFAGVGDTIEVRPAEDISLRVEGPFADTLPSGSENLVVRAAYALAGAAGYDGGAEILLTKRLPPASGIGGGSADAAATIKALADLWGVHFTPAEMAAIGIKLGADVPMCIEGRPLLVAGVGEVLAPAPALPPFWLVLVNPGVQVATPAVFKARTGDFSPPCPLITAPADIAELAAMLDERGNDLTPAAMTLAPIIGRVLAAIQVTPNVLLARMSGSGATCFGIYANQNEAQIAADQIAAAQPEWWVAAAPVLG